MRTWNFMLLLTACLAGCLARAPVHPEAERLNLAGARDLQQGRLERARTSLELSLEYNPCFAAALHNLALVELARGRLEMAERREREALECQPELVQAINGLGVIAWRRGQRESALEAFQNALALDPGYHDARRNLAALALESGRLELASRQLERLAVLLPGDAWVADMQRRLVLAVSARQRGGRS